MEGEPKETFVVVDRIRETENVATLKLTLEDGTVPVYAPGQFITVYFPDTHTPEGKAYSMSSMPSDKTLDITVKAIGEFSHRLCGMQSGDTFTASLPYGYFYSELENTDLVMLAAGIGITPFRSMLRCYLKGGTGRKLYLFYSNRTVRDIVFKEELDKLAGDNDNMFMEYHITRQTASAGMVDGRMEADSIFEKVGGKNAEFLLCGSVSFVRDMWRGLRQKNISEELIYTEAFFSQ